MPYGCPEIESGSTEYTRLLLALFTVETVIKLFAITCVRRWRIFFSEARSSILTRVWWACISCHCVVSVWFARLFSACWECVICKIVFSMLSVCDLQDCYQHVVSVWFARLLSACCQCVICKIVISMLRVCDLQDCFRHGTCMYGYWWYRALC